MRGGSMNWALPHSTEINTININTEILVPLSLSLYCAGLYEAYSHSSR